MAAITAMAQGFLLTLTLAGAVAPGERLARLRAAPPRKPLLDYVTADGSFSGEGRSYLVGLADLARRRDALRAGKKTPKEQTEALVKELNAFQREQVRRLPPIAFFTRHPLSRPNAAACYIWQSVPERWGCSIRVCDPARPERPPRVLFSDPEGSIFDMSLSRDAATLLFSCRRRAERHWQLYELSVAGGKPRKISRDARFHDVAAEELPDGDLVFVSTRPGSYTVCQPGPSSNLYRMRRDGSAVRRVSQNTLSDFSPHLLPDGRVLFTRWEYVDRDLTYRQSLWTEYPDGGRYQLFFGNTIRDPGTFWQARPVPGHPGLVVATFAPHHGWPHGAIGLIHSRLGLEAPRGEGFAWLTDEFPQIGDRSFRWSFRDPFPLNDYQFLVAYGRGGRFAIWLLDLCNNKLPVISDPKMGCYNPLPLRPQPVPPKLASRPAANDQDRWGTVLLLDVYQGLLPQVQRGQVRYIQIMEQQPKTHDLRSRAYDESPIMGYGTYYAKKCWGRVPVEPDGSAHFRVPALHEVYLQVLDAQGRELQRMTSALQLMPGETIGCIGCHEPRNTAPPNLSAAAARRPPDTPQPPPWGKDGILDFVKVVQPALDRHCVRCHSGPHPDGGCDLSGDKTRFFNMAYDNLLGRSRSYRQHDMATGEMLPGEKAKGKPLVHFFWLLRTPTAINRPLWTGSHASALLGYIEGDHCGEPIPPSDRQRIYAWIDANVPYYATYANSRPRSPGCRDLCTDVRTGRDAAWFARDFLGVYNKRCTRCHGPVPHPNDHGRIWDGRLAWMNFTHPEWSPALAAHLAREAGGRGISTEKGKNTRLLFTNTRDPDYQRMLEAIRRGRRDMLTHPRVDCFSAAPESQTGD